jgi:hypothetical protein
VAGTFEVPIGGSIIWSQLMLIEEGHENPHLLLRQENEKLAQIKVEL